MKYEITTIRLDVTKNRMHRNNAQGVASITSLLGHGWEFSGSMVMGDDLVVFVRKRRWHWRFWRKPEAPPGKKAFAVYRQ